MRLKPIFVILETALSLILILVSSKTLLQLLVVSNLVIGALNVENFGLKKNTGTLALVRVSYAGLSFLSFENNRTSFCYDHHLNGVESNCYFFVPIFMPQKKLAKVGVKSIYSAC